MLEVEVHTKDERARTGIHLVVVTIGNLRIDAVVLRDCEHIGAGEVGTTIELVVEQIERVA